MRRMEEQNKVTVRISYVGQISNTCIWVPRRKRDKGIGEMCLKVMGKDFSKLMKDHKPQIQEFRVLQAG